MNKIATIDEFWAAAARHFPLPSPEEQRAGAMLFQQLARGERATISQLSPALKASALRRFVNANEEGQIQGFWGLSVTPTHHQVTVKGRKFWAWCAVDTLFIPELLGETAEIESPDPETGQMIHLTVSPDRIEAAEPKGIVASLVRPDTFDVTSAHDLIASACHFLFFFASRASGERWQAKHPKTVLVPLDEAFTFARLADAHVFGVELEQRRREA